MYFELLIVSIVESKLQIINICSIWILPSFLTLLPIKPQKTVSLLSTGDADEELVWLVTYKKRLEEEEQQEGAARSYDGVWWKSCL